jgi:hypothetical protein
MLMENAIKHTKDVFITFLRIYFNNPANYKNKLPIQISDEHFKETAFYDSEPEELRTFPTVIISASTGNMITSGLGDMCTEIKDPRTSAIIAYRYQGIYEFAITIDIGCRNPLDREVFTDLVAKALRFSLRRFIQNQGVIIKDVSYAGETTIDYNSDKIYVSQLRINTWSTWIEDVDLLDPNEFNVNVDMNLKVDDKWIEHNPVTRDEKNIEKNGENK